MTKNKEKPSDRLKDIIDASFGVEVNMNDVFAWGCADSEKVAGSDLIDLLPYIDRHGWDAQIALVSIIREFRDGQRMDPQKAMRCENYQKAREEILGEISDPAKDTFFETRGFKEECEREMKKYGEKLRHASARTRSGLIAQVLYLDQKRVYGIGANLKEAREDLERKVNTDRRDELEKTLRDILEFVKNPPALKTGDKASDLERAVERAQRLVNER